MSAVTFPATPTNPHSTTPRHAGEAGKAGRLEARRVRAAAAREELRRAAEAARRVDDIFTPGDFSTRPRPVRVHAAGPAPVRWDPRAGRFVRGFAAHPIGWGVVAVVFAMAAFAIADALRMAVLP